MSDDLMDRFDDVEESATITDTDTDTETETETDEESRIDSTRSRSQYPIYLSGKLQEELDDRYNKFNARRELDDKEQVEKHRHFLEGVIRSALDQENLEEYIEEEFQNDER
jgi:hypothetical protein